MSPHATSGFSGSEIVSRILQFIGSTNSALQTYLENTLAMAEMRFCKMNDWTFLEKTALSLAVTAGTHEYTLNTAAIGFEMLAKDVHRIYDPTNKIVLTRIKLADIREIDPELNDGSSTNYPMHWAPIQRNKIKLYVPSFANNTLKIDGKILPNVFNAGTSTMASYPTIPYEYQEGFIMYVTALALQHEDDDRYPIIMSTAAEMIKKDIQSDSAEAEENYSFRQPDEVFGKILTIEDINRALWNKS